MLSFKPQAVKFDRILFFLVLMLSFLGVLLIYDASAATAMQTFGNRYYFASHQLGWIGLGILVMLITMNINYHFWRRVAWLMLIFSLVSLVLVLLPGLGIKVLGGRRWLNFGLLPFQPAEFAKIILIIYLTAYFEKKIKFLHFLVLLAVFSLLLMLEPDLGTTVVLISTAFVIYFLVGGKIWEFLILGLFGVLSGLGFILISPYRLARLKVFLNPDLDPQGSSYHLRQILLALGSGGLWGRGIGQSRQKFLFLPEAATDSIFAVIGEEIGFVGAVAFLAFFLFLLIRGLKIAQEAPDKFGQVLAGGIASLIFIQFFLNLASMVSLIPLTGVPLPFISYGGSFLLVAYWGLGILLNISKFCLKDKS